MSRPGSEWTRTLWGLIGLVTVTSTALAIWIHHVWSHSDQVLATAVRAHLDRIAPDVDVQFSSCRFDLLRRVRVDDIELTTRDGRKLASIPSITVAIDRDALAQRQQLVIQHITLHQPHLHLARNDSGQWNWQNLINHTGQPIQLPEWTVQDARIDIQLDGQPGQARTLQHLDLQLVPGGHDRYVIDAHAQVLAQHPATSTAQLELNGHWQLTKPTDQADQADQADQTAHGLSLDGTLNDFTIDKSLVELVTELAGSKLPSSLPDGLPDLAELASGLGQADLAFRVTRWDPKADWDYRMLLTLKQGQLTLPLPNGPDRTLSRIQGQVYLDPRQLQIKNLRGYEAGTSAIVNGLVARSNTTQGSRLDVALKDVALDQRLRKQLPAAWQTLLDVYAPSGTVHITTSLELSPTGSWTPTNSVLTANSCKVKHARFPYPLEQLTGTLSQQGATRDWTVQIDAIAAGRPVQFRGQIQNAGPEAASQLDISVDRLPIDDQLLQAVSPAARRSLEALALRGAVDLRARIVRPPGTNRKPTTTLNGRLVQASVRFDKFPWPINEITGNFQATIQPNQYDWTFEKLNGHHRHASVNGSAHFDGQSGQPRHFALDLDVQHVNLDDQLRNACTKELADLWDRIRPSGSLDGRIEFRRENSQPVQITIPHFTIDRGTLQLTAFPYKLTNVHASGHYGLTDDNHRRLTLNSLAARHGETRITTGGILEIDNRKDWMIRLESLACNKLVANNDLLQALPPRLRQTLIGLNPQGPFHVGGLIELRGAGEPGFPITAAWNLETRLPGNQLSAGVQLKHVAGRITSRGKWYGQHAEMTGHFALDSATLWGYRFQDIRGPFHYRNHDLVIGSSQAFAPKRTRRDNLNIPLQERVTARAVGGLFTLDAQARIDELSHYHVKMNMSEAKLEQFAKLYLKDPQKLKGVMRGWVDLRGRGNSPADVVGRGQLQVSPAELYQLPIIVQLFDVLSLGPQQQTAFRYAQCDFQVARSRIQFNSIDLVGNSLQLRGRGEATFAGQVGLDFYSMLPTSRLNIPFLQPLITPLTTGWVAVRVDGKTNNPRARIRPAPVLDDALRGFLSALEHPARKRQLPPLNPPFGQRRTSLIPNSPTTRIDRNPKR
ncbi:MAG: hypothetical protein VB861_16015 [Planctomycetaceae bacterium]